MCKSDPGRGPGPGSWHVRALRGNFREAPGRASGVHSGREARVVRPSDSADYRELELRTQRGVTFASVAFTTGTSGGMGEHFQRLLWHPHWKRAEAKDHAMGIT